LNNFESKIGEVSLIPSDGGRFEVQINGDLIFSKLNLKRHAEKDEIKDLINTYISEGKK
jgi:selenoprotein W-related protein